LFFAYVLGTGTGYWPREEADAEHQSYGWNYLLLCSFAIQHSCMQRRNFWRLPAPYERSLYGAASGIVLGGMTLLWRPVPGGIIWEGPLWIVAISLAAAIGTGCCCASINHTTFMGLAQAWTGNAEARGPLCTEGPYRYVRHPLMLGLLIALWAQPIMPAELMMMNGGLTLYVLIALELEENDLVRDYGEEYEKYRKEVPMLIPWKVFSRRSQA
jgi:protein-S-isoprenylcysteine O-methyltransferase Ste14